MTIRKVITLCIGVCALLFVMAAAALAYNISQENSLKVTIDLAAMALLAAHGIYRSLQHMAAIRTTPVKPDAERCSETVLSEAMSRRQVWRMFFDPRDKDIFASFNLLLLVWTATSSHWTAFAVILAWTLALPAWALIKGLRQAGTMKRQHMHIKVDKQGVALVAADVNEGGTACATHAAQTWRPVKEAQWKDIIEVFRHKDHCVFRSNKDIYIFFYRSAESKELCLRLINENFKGCNGTKPAAGKKSPNAGLTAAQEREKAEAIAQEIRRRNALTCYRLVPSSRRTPELTDTKLGGLPYWDADEAYPTDAKGRKMMLLAQVNFSKDRMGAPLPQEGILQFFITADEDDGTYGCDPKYMCAQTNFRVVFHEHIDAGVTRQQVEAMDLPICEESDASPVYHETALDVSTATSYPAPSVSGFDEMFNEAIHNLFNEPPTTPRHYFAHKENEEALDEILCGEEHAQLLGHPSFTQYDPRDEDTYSRYDTLLLQIPSIFDEDLCDGNGDDVTMWGDCGIANFFINSEDLARHDFSRVLYNWDCY